ncbi:MAG: helix-turn-helix transcriptional regulator [Planctomycetota bacterium]
MIAIRRGAAAIEFQGERKSTSVGRSEFALLTGEAESTIRPLGTTPASLLIAQFDALSRSSAIFGALLSSDCYTATTGHPGIAKLVPFLEIAEQFDHDDVLSDQIVLEKFAELLLVQLASHALSESNVIHHATMAQPQTSVNQKIHSVIHGFWSSPGKPWTLASMAKVAQLSRSTFAKQFRLIVGDSPLQYLTDVRMNLACRMLQDHELTVSVIGTRVGYENGSSFSSAFKKWSGQSPIDYRKSLNSPPPNSAEA